MLQWVLLVLGIGLIVLANIMMAFSNKKMERANKDLGDAIKERKKAAKIFKEVTNAMMWSEELMDITLATSKGEMTREKARKRCEELQRNAQESRGIVLGLIRSCQREYEKDMKDG